MKIIPKLTKKVCVIKNYVNPHRRYESIKCI